MLSSSTIVEAVAKKLKEYTPPAIVVDPVMISKSKFPLLKEEAIDSLKTVLIPLATVITPNVYEAELLAQQDIRNIDDAKNAAKNDCRPRVPRRSRQRWASHRRRRNRCALLQR